MANANDTSQFDLITFRKCVRLLDSSNAGEREAALTQALRVCAQSKLLFFEAAGLAFGTNTAERDNLIAKVAQLQSQIAAMQLEAQQKTAQMA